MQELLLFSGASPIQKKHCTAAIYQ